MGSLTGKLPQVNANRAIDLPYHDEYDTAYYGEIGPLYSEEEDIEQPYSVSHRLGKFTFLYTITSSSHNIPIKCSRSLKKIGRG